MPQAGSARQSYISGKEQVELSSRASSEALIAERYAGALSALAEGPALETVAQDLKTLRAMLSDSEDLRRAVASPMVTHEEHARVIQALSAGAGFSALTRKFLGVVAGNNRLGAIIAIMDAFLADVARRRGQVEVEVTTAKALDEKRLGEIEHSLNTALAAKATLKVTVDPALIGGIVIKVGSRLIDASVKTRLDRLGRILKSAA
jgi:F-type H+-transporting ATPase subunit delta